MLSLTPQTSVDRSRESPHVLFVSSELAICRRDDTPHIRGLQLRVDARLYGSFLEVVPGSISVL